jgi:hypothetical protein
MKQHSEQFLRKRRMLLILPLLILPFITFGFWRLGGGKGELQHAAAIKGINITLPNADLKNVKPKDKLGIYEQNKRDSASQIGKEATSALGFDTAGHAATTNQNKGSSTTISAESNESQINDRLKQIKQEINKPSKGTNNSVAKYPADDPSSVYLDRMEKISKSRNTFDKEDPEMKQLSSMLEKIMDIQHPERLYNKQQLSDKAGNDSLYKAFRAVIVDNQKITQGSSIKLRLVDTMILNRQVIPKGLFVFGLCQITNQRIILNIKNIRLGTSILPVDLTVYDMDGMPGINVPELLTQDAMRSGSDNAVQSLQFMTMDQSTTTQLAGAGIEAAKGLFSKKVKRIKVKLKAGYPLLLRNNQAKH